MNIDCSETAIGRGVTLLDTLDVRRRRQDTQRAPTGQYHLPVIPLTLNTMGPIKIFPLVVGTFYEGVGLIGAQLDAQKIPILYTRFITAHTGCEYFWVVDGDLCFTKRILCLLEDSLSSGRPFDVDVINTDGREISRIELGFPVRKCLLRSRDTSACGRAGTHTVKELLNKECQLMKEYFTCRYAKEFSSLSMLALLYEVSTTPKPGLADRSNTGAHRDMDILAFEASAVSLDHSFEEFALCGMENSHESFSRIFSRLRSLGIQTEDVMMKAAHSINAHKGLISPLVIIDCPLGYMYVSQTPYPQNNLLSVSRRPVEDVLEDFKDITAENTRINGERPYTLYGTKGARGGALPEYHTVLKVAPPVFKNYLGRGFSINDTGTMAPLHIIANSENTNIVDCSSCGEMKEIQGNLEKMLQEEEIMRGQDVKARLGAKVRPTYIEDLDQDFIQRNINPGGSADLLALTYFAYLFKKEFG